VSLDAFADFCARLTLDSGQRMVLEPFQRRMLGDYFAGARESLILLPKGNAKTTTLAALALFELCTRADAEIVIAAAARDQAGIMLRQAAGFVRRSPALQARLTVKQREVAHRQLGGRVRILASDVDTADGLIVDLALVDELHRHHSPELYAVLRDGLGKRNGRMVTISTAGWDRDSPLWKARQSALERGAAREGAYLRGGHPDGSFALHEWSLVDGRDDPDDLAVVKQANPLSALTVEHLRARHESPTTTRGEWLRFACNLWTEGEDEWLPADAWEGCEDPDAEIPAQVEVVLGVDVATKRDTSAVVRLWRRPDGRVVVEAEVYAPRGDGTAVDLSLVEAAIRRNADRYDVRTVAFDPWSFARSAEELSDGGLLMVEVPQSAERMTIASQDLYTAIVGGEIAHGGDPVLAAHVRAGAVKQHERGWRLVKGKSRRPIDALIALALAYSQLGAELTYDGPLLERLI